MLMPPQLRLHFTAAVEAKPLPRSLTNSNAAGFAVRTVSYPARQSFRAKQAAEKLCTGQESNTSGAKARRILNLYGPTKVVP
jgi:hypothetical protein